MTTPPRVTTPLGKTLLDLLSDADLGATGFLKPNELKAVLLKLGKVRTGPEMHNVLLSNSPPVFTCLHITSFQKHSTLKK
jgi:hypothetical protein